MLNLVLLSFVIVWRQLLIQYKKGQVTLDRSPGFFKLLVYMYHIETAHALWCANLKEGLSMMLHVYTKYQGSRSSGSEKRGFVFHFSSQRKTGFL